MASLLRTAFIRVGPAPTKVATCTAVQKRFIMGRAMKAGLPTPSEPREQAFDYENLDYTWIRSLFDRTTHRLDQNSKVIVVEGPVAVGKTKFAQALACELDMKHYPEATMDLHYVRPNGCDLRMFNDKVPHDARTFDHMDWNLNPCDRLVGNFQIMMYTARYGQYIDALTHLLNSGQGVVLERSPFSDFVFLEAMYSQGHLSRGVRSVYYDLRNNSIEELLRPHLVIYLDAEVEKVQTNIVSRGFKHEVEGKALTPNFLCTMERFYKDKYLRDISTHAELLVYDWSGGGEVEVVVEDIERIDFDQERHREDPKMKDWRFPREVEWADARMKYTNCKHYLMNLFSIPRLDVPELITSADDAYEREKVIYEHPSFRYEHGYNCGGTLFKNSLPKYTEYV